VIIADDSALVRERLVAMLSELEGVELVGQAGDARSALRAIQELEPHVAILDIRMPGGNGIQALQAVKDRDPTVRVIMLTAFPYPQYRQRCLEAGADYFFDKSAEFECVAQALAELATLPTPEKEETHA
jgi:DNA-binding NarL/FixJ family response regulator